MKKILHVFLPTPMFTLSPKVPAAGLVYTSESVDLALRLFSVAHDRTEPAARRGYCSSSSMLERGVFVMHYQHHEFWPGLAWATLAPIVFPPPILSFWGHVHT